MIIKQMLAAGLLLFSVSVSAVELPVDAPQDVRATFSCVFSEYATDSQKSIQSYQAVLGLKGKIRKSLRRSDASFSAYLPAHAVDSLLTNNPAIERCERNGLV